MAAACDSRSRYAQSGIFTAKVATGQQDRSPKEGPTVSDDVRTVKLETATLGRTLGADRDEDW